jgi:hypothetical protein
MFLDREPYIRYWRPAYRVLGPVLRPSKGALLGFAGLFTGRSGRAIQRIDTRLAAMEAAQQQFYSALEQVLLSSFADRQVNQAIESIERRLTVIEGQLGPGAAVRWDSVEQLLIGFLTTVNRNAENNEALRGELETLRAAASRDTVL